MDVFDKLRRTTEAYRTATAAQVAAAAEIARERDERAALGVPLVQSETGDRS